MSSEDIRKLAFSSGLSLGRPSAVPEGSEPPSELLVLRLGVTEFTRGGRAGSFEVTAEDAMRILAEASGRGRDVVVDYDHASVRGRDAPAAGWLTGLRLAGDGIRGDVSWTPRAAAMLSAREYRYLSPVLLFRDGRPSALHSVALTNTPAFHSYPAIVADDGDETTPNHKGDTMNQKIARIARLFGERIAFSDGGELPSDALDATLAAAEKLLADHGCATFAELDGHIHALVPAERLEEAKRELSGIRAERLVAQAFAEGRLVEAQRAWATDYATREPEAFADYLKSIPENTYPTSAAQFSDCAAPKCRKGGRDAYSEQEIAIMRKLGLSDEDIDKAAAERNCKED